VIALLVFVVIAVGLAWRYGAANLSWRYRVPARPPKPALDRTPAAPRISILSARTVQVSVVVARFGRIDRSSGEPPCARRCRRTDARWRGADSSAKRAFVGNQPMLLALSTPAAFTLGGVECAVCGAGEVASAVFSMVAGQGETTAAIVSLSSLDVAWLLRSQIASAQVRRSTMPGLWHGRPVF